MHFISSCNETLYDTFKSEEEWKYICIIFQEETQSFYGITQTLRQRWHTKRRRISRLIPSPTLELLSLSLSLEWIRRFVADLSRAVVRWTKLIHSRESDNLHPNRYILTVAWTRKGKNHKSDTKPRKPTHLLMTRTRFHHLYLLPV